MCAFLCFSLKGGRWNVIISRGSFVLYLCVFLCICILWKSQMSYEKVSFAVLTLLGLIEPIHRTSFNFVLWYGTTCICKCETCLVNSNLRLEMRKKKLCKIYNLSLSLNCLLEIQHCGLFYKCIKKGIARGHNFPSILLVKPDFRS